MEAGRLLSLIAISASFLLLLLSLFPFWCVRGVFARLPFFPAL